MTEQHLQIEGIETTTNPLFWDYFVAQHTKTMRVGQLGMNLTAINPIQFAENIAMLDHFTGGRVFAGFSRGNTPRWVGTFGQHLGITSTESDRSAADQRNRAVFYENWRIVKELWTKPTTSIQGEHWKVPPDMDWQFPPTGDFAAAHGRWTKATARNRHCAAAAATTASAGLRALQLQHGDRSFLGAGRRQAGFVCCP